MVLSLCMPWNLLVNLWIQIPGSHLQSSWFSSSGAGPENLHFQQGDADPAPWEPCIEKHCHEACILLSRSHWWGLWDTEKQNHLSLYILNILSLKKKPKIPSYHKIIMEFSNAGFLIFYYGFSFITVLLTWYWLSTVWDREPVLFIFPYR